MALLLCVRPHGEVGRLILDLNGLVGHSLYVGSNYLSEREALPTTAAAQNCRQSEIYFALFFLVSVAALAFEYK